MTPHRIFFPSNTQQRITPDLNFWMSQNFKIKRTVYPQNGNVVRFNEKCSLLEQQENQSNNYVYNTCSLYIYILTAYYM